MSQDFRAQLAKWHQNDEFDQIIESLESLDELDDELAGHLARAYNNRGAEGDGDKAISLLLTWKESGKNDPVWHFRLGYAYYYADREAEAAEEFEQVLALDPDDDDAKELLNSCREILQSRAGRKQENFDPELYTQAELDAVESHIQQYFGDYPNVFHEIVSPDIHIDLCIIPPTPERNYYIVVTMGMGAHRMNVPDELREQKLERAELLICLSPDWQINHSGENWYWPLRCLKLLARLPGEEDTWLGWGHTIDNQEPYAENTELSAALIISADEFGEDACVCDLPDGDEVNFYQVVPLYYEEMRFKMEHNAQTLLERMSKGDFILDLQRENICAEMEFEDEEEDEEEPEKNFAILPEKMKELLTDWNEPAGCIASDRILVDGYKVGYCYREEPDDDLPDSGWRFLAGDEDDAYMDDPDNAGVYALNTLCNYDPDILPLLHAPIGSAFERDENGHFVAVKED